MSSPAPALQTQLLYRLHQVDVGLAEADQRLGQLPPAEPVRESVQEAEQAHAQAESDLVERQARMRALELELQSTIAKHKRVEDEMYSGRVGNPKELAAMQDELGQLDRQTQGLEDDVLGLMEDVEALLARVPALARKAAEARDALASHEEQVRRDRAQLESTREALTGERQTLAEALDPDLLRRYERIRERSGGTAVAAVLGDICGGCHMAVPEARVRRLAEEPETIITCERCARILVLAER